MLKKILYISLLMSSTHFVYAGKEAQARRSTASPASKGSPKGATPLSPAKKFVDPHIFSLQQEIAALKETGCDEEVARLEALLASKRAAAAVPAFTL